MKLVRKHWNYIALGGASCAAVAFIALPKPGADKATDLSVGVFPGEGAATAEVGTGESSELDAAPQEALDPAAQVTNVAPKPPPSAAERERTLMRALAAVRGLDQAEQRAPRLEFDHVAQALETQQANARSTTPITVVAPTTEAAAVTQAVALPRLDPTAPLAALEARHEALRAERELVRQLEEEPLSAILLRTTDSRVWFGGRSFGVGDQLEGGLAQVERIERCVVTLRQGERLLAVRLPAVSSSAPAPDANEDAQAPAAPQSPPTPSKPIPTSSAPVPPAAPAQESTPNAVQPN
jgi:hypothetical protein